MTPTTPFEDSGHITLTTPGQEAEYVATLIEKHPNIGRIELGESVEGRPIYALKIGAGNRRPVVLITSIHADEPCPREAALTLIRDLSDTPDQRVAPLLSERALYIIPTPNPDGFPNSRLNASGVNLNREYISLPDSGPEVQIISDFLYDMDPIFVLDAHEWMHSTDVDPIFLGAVEFASGRGVRDAARDTALAIMASLDRTIPWYPSSAMGTGRHVLPTGGIPALLSETVFAYSSASASRPRRYADNRAIFDAWLIHMTAHAKEYEAGSVAARADIAVRVDRTATTWPIDLRIPMEGGTSSGTAISAAGYIVPESEWPSAKSLLDLHRVDYDAASRTVSLAQEKAQVAVLVLDPASPYTVSPGATRLQAPAIPPPRFGYDPAMDLYGNMVT